MARVPRRGVREMAITEVIRYGKLLGALPGTPPVRDAIGSFAAAGHPAPARLSALGFYLDRGTSGELAALEPLVRDMPRVPACARGTDGCEWHCEIASDGGQVMKSISTLGDFVQYCVKPAILEREKAPAAASKTAKN